MKGKLKNAFETLKEGVRQLQSAAAGGDLEAVELGLSELLITMEHVQQTVLDVVPAET